MQQVAELLSLRGGQEPPFEDALALCEHVRNVRAQLDALLEHSERIKVASTPTPRGRNVLGGAVEDEEQAGTYVALGGVSEDKVRSIRAQFGYQLFAKGDFSRGLFHLLEAQEPPNNVLALFPQLLPDSASSALLVIAYVPHRSAHCADVPPLEYPGLMPVMIDTTLGAAVRPLLRYLSRVRLQDGLFDGEETLSAIRSTSTSISTDSYLLTPRQLVDCVLLTGSLWLEAHLLSGTSNATDRQHGTQGDSMRDATRLHMRIMRLLRSPNHLDVGEALMQLRAFYKDPRLAECELGAYIVLFSFY